MERRLYRSRTDRMLAGVAGGLGWYFDVDPTVVRILWVALTILSGGAFLLIYIAMAIIVPEEPWPAEADTGTYAGGTVPGDASTGPRTGPRAPSGMPPGRPSTRRDSDAGLLLGAALVVIGALFLLRNLIPAIDFDVLWPIAVVALGVLLVVGSARRGSGGS